MPPEKIAPATSAVAATPLVRRLAGQHGVDLTAVHGTGIGGRIRQQDVEASARSRMPALAAAATRGAPASGTATSGRFPAPTPADVTPAGRDAALVQMARAEGPEPTLFATGDLPPFTASGLAPEMLLEVPWRARHSMAAAPTTADAYAIVTDFADLGLEEALAWADFGGYAKHRGNQEFEHRMSAWLAGTSPVVPDADQTGARQ